MSTSVCEIRKARKTYTCTEASYHTIRPGDLYLYGACPPWHDCGNGQSWAILRACLRCAERYGMLCSGARAQIAARNLTRKEGSSP